MAQPKATTCKEAIQRWEEKYGLPANEQTEISLSFQWPPIEKMDNNLAALTAVRLASRFVPSLPFIHACPCRFLVSVSFFFYRKLSLSTNAIEKIAGINSLKNLKILSLGRNYIKSFSGLEAIGEHLEELWISYNMIEKIKGVGVLKALRVLYMANNLVKDWVEFNRLQEIPNLEDLQFINNPICENMDVESWRSQVLKRLPNLKKLDAVTILCV